MMDTAGKRATTDLGRDPWYLVEAGHYRCAIAAYTERLTRDPSAPSLRNRGTARFLIGDIQGALADFRQAALMQRPGYSVDSDSIFQGVCHWHLGQPVAAVECWRAALEARMTDWAGGARCFALLLYAGLRLHDAVLAKEALGLLRARWRKHRRRERAIERRGYPTRYQMLHRELHAWPGPLVLFLLGHIDVDAFQRQAGDIDSEIVRIRQRCQADFSVALRALMEGDQRLFREAMTGCSSSPYGLLEHEFYLARWEVQHGFPEPPFAGAPSGG